MIDLLISIAFGAIAGWIASIIMGTKGGLLRNIIMGIIGGFVGSWLFGLIKISLPFSATISNMIISVIGACVVIFIGRLIFK